jgi:hypothetical protein
MKSEAETDTGGIRHKLEAEMIGNWGYIQQRDQPRQHAFPLQAFVVVLMNSELNNIDDT